MGKSVYFETNFLKQVFQGTPAITNWTATGGSTSVWLGLHTADPTGMGSTSAEGGYAAYTRIRVDRSASGWSLTSGTTLAAASVSPLATVSFPQQTTAGAATVGYCSIWSSSADVATGMIYSGTVTPNITLGQNVTPQLTTATAITES